MKTAIYSKAETLRAELQAAREAISEATNLAPVRRRQGARGLPAIAAGALRSDGETRPLEVVRPDR